VDAAFPAFFLLLKPSGPLVLGHHRLPALAVKVTTLLSPVLLAGLLRAPVLVAVACAIVVTAVLRLLLGG
jgi:hypothetical protein